jgi:hypothetical protein
MANAHVKDLLSEFLDNELEAAQLAQVEAHLKGCAECRDELTALKSMSRMLGDMPQKELPAGFFARLSSKRRTQEASASGLSWMPLSVPRMAAVAMTCLLITFVFYREVRYRLAPTILPAAHTSSDLDRQMQEIDADLTPEAIDAKRRELVANNKDRPRWNGLAESEESNNDGRSLRGAQAPQAPGASGSQANLPADRAMSQKELQDKFSALTKGAVAKAQKRKTPARALGKALESKKEDAGRKQPTNAQIAEFLAKERKRMGIVKTVPPHSDPTTPWSGIEKKPMNRDEARKAMRRYSQNLARINEINRWKKSPTVPLGSGSTPKLIGAGNSKSGYSFAGGGGGSLAFSDARTRVVAEPAAAKSSLTTIRGGALGHADDMVARRPMPKAVAAPVAPMAANTKPLQMIKIEQQWSATEGGMPTGGAAVIKESKHWKDLVTRIGRKEISAPDFNTHMAIGVFSGNVQNHRTTVAVVQIFEQGNALVVQYRLQPSDAIEKGKTFSAYHLVVIAKSDLPPLLQRVP